MIKKHNCLFKQSTFAFCKCRRSLQSLMKRYTFLVEKSSGNFRKTLGSICRCTEYFFGKPWCGSICRLKADFGNIVHYGYSLKVISNFDSQASWNLCQCQKSWKKWISLRASWENCGFLNGHHLKCNKHKIGGP